MGLRSWSAVLSLAAGAGTAAVISRRRSRVLTRPPAMAGVDGLGEPEPATDAARQPVAEAPAAPAEAVAEGTDDAITKLDEARERLRRRADELRDDIARTE
ncbi:MAG: hypothetical protein U0Y82_14225 [Thermoleophilia bacterium]